MADSPNGFTPVRHLNGSPWNGNVSYYLVPSGDSTAIYVGDLVKHGGTSGAAGLVVNGMDMEGVPTIAREVASTSGVNTLGVVVGFLPDPTSLQTKYRTLNSATN